MASFLKEIQEELQEEAWYQFIRKNLGLIVGGLAAFLLVVALWLGWSSWSKRTQERQSTQFEKALSLLETGDLAGAKPILQGLEKESPNRGYGLLARACLSGARYRQALKTFDPDDIKAWEEGAEALENQFQESGEKVLSSCMRMNRGFGALTLHAPLDPQIFQSFQTAQHPWRHVAMEGQLLLASRMKDEREVSRLVTSLVNDRRVLPAVAGRARLAGIAAGVSWTEPTDKSPETQESPAKDAAAK